MKLWIVLGTLIMFSGVALGAFGAHSLKTVLTPETKPIYQTAVLYHLVHGLAILIVALLINSMRGPFASMAGWLFLIGIFLFSGSLYALSVTGISRLGAITPLGGLAFLVGWLSLFIGALRI